jgi:hypothetical protein
MFLNRFTARFSFLLKSNRHARQALTCWKFHRRALCPCYLMKKHAQLRLEKKIKKAGSVDKFLLTANIEFQVLIAIKKQN